MKRFKLSRACSLCLLSLFILFSFGANVASARWISYSFVNYSGYTIKNLYISASGYNKWGKDLLGKSVLQNGDSVSLRYNNDSRYFDIKVVWMDGSNSTCSRHDYKSVWRVTLYKKGSTFYVKNN